MIGVTGYEVTGSKRKLHKMIAGPSFLNTFKAQLRKCQLTKLQSNLIVTKGSSHSECFKTGNSPMETGIFDCRFVN